MPVHLVFLEDGGKMSGNDKHGAPKRQYPAFYERFIPIALGIIILAILILLIVIFGVALGLFSA
jgi:hypothetical protein